jgi:hypothetical protein
MVLIVMLLGVILAIALAMHISTEEELDKGFIGIGVVVLLVICVWIFGLVKNNPSGNLMETKASEITTVVVDKKTSTSSYYIPVNNVPLFFHNTHYKIVIEDEGAKDTISVSEKVYDQLSVGDKVEVSKKVTYLFGTYFGTDYTLKN